MRLSTLVALVMTVTGVAGLMPATVSAQVNDPPRIVGWRLIGNAGLGMSRERVEYVYGHRVPDRRTYPYDLSTYQVHGGKLLINYTRGLVDGVSTDSLYYRTKDGIGVGTRIPLGPCHRTKSRPCERRWKGFVLENGGRTWFRTLPYGRRTIQAWLWVERGAITQIDLKFFDRYSPNWNAG